MCCPSCLYFLQDFIATSIPNEDLSFGKHIRKKNLPAISAELADWIYRIQKRLPRGAFEKSFDTASRIARRNRKLQDYENLLLSSTFNMLLFEIDWILGEVNYMKIYLVEKNVFQGKETTKLFIHAFQYISYITSLSLLHLCHIHEDHITPKGLSTQVDSVLPKRRMLLSFKETDTLADTDDYQSEILNEDSDEDLYS